MVWTALAALAVVGLASVQPAAASARLTDAGVSTVEGVTTAVPAPLLAHAQAGSSTAQAIPAQAGAPTTASTTGAYRSSAYATGFPDGRAASAMRVALDQIGLPYVWGGDGPVNGDAGFDCSGLTHHSYGAVEISLPRTAHTQFYAGPRVAAGAPLQPGDLVFYGTLARVHHVGMYIGEGRMVNAPTFGEPVQTAYYRWVGDDYVGATRPAASSTGASSALPFIPEPAAPPAAAPDATPDVFAAPPASLPSNLPAPGAVQVPEAQSAKAALTEQEQTHPTSAPAALTDPARVTTSASAGAPSTTLAPSAPAQPVVADPAASRAPAPTTTTAAAAPATAATQPTTTATQSTTTAAATATATPTTPPTTTAAAATTTVATATPAPPTTATRPPTATTPPVSAAPAVAASTKPSPAITIGGVTTKLGTTIASAAGLPAKAGVWTRPGRPVIRLGATSATVGSSITLQLGTAAAATYTLASSTVMTTAQSAAAVATAPHGELIILTPAAAGSWTVLTAT